LHGREGMVSAYFLQRKNRHAEKFFQLFQTLMLAALLVDNKSRDFSGTTFFTTLKTNIMNKDKDTHIERNRPSDDGRRHDPDLRDESAIQPGVQTISPSSTDDANQHLTRSALDGPERTQFDTDDTADPTFDTIGGDA